MSAFSSAWLDLREPLDRAARATELERRLRLLRPAVERWRIVDLGCGSGANLRHLATRLGGAQHWLLVDHDGTLLDAAAARIATWSAAAGAGHAPATQHGAGQTFDLRTTDLHCRVQLQRHDLATADLPALLDGQHLVTASALLDLVGEAWLCGLLQVAAAQRSALLFTLSYDGRASCEPALDDDAWIIDAVNRHQCRDKGLGAALGPGAARRAADIAAGCGLRVYEADSPWRIGPQHRRMQAALLAGWAEAARELLPDAAERVQHWLRQRMALADAGRSRMMVGHRDLLAVPEPP